MPACHKYSAQLLVCKLLTGLRCQQQGGQRQLSGSLYAAAMVASIMSRSHWLLLGPAVSACLGAAAIACYRCRIRLAHAVRAVNATRGHSKALVSYSMR
jgi:hypothetical protein